VEKQVFVAMAITLSVGIFPARGRCQAAAEYSITTSHVAAGAAKAGSALDKAMQGIAGRVQEKVSKATEQPRETSRQPSRILGDHPLAANAQTINSANGIEVVCGPSDAKTTDTKQKPGSQSKPCLSSHGEDLQGNKANHPAKPDAPANYPSVVNLSFTK